MVSALVVYTAVALSSPGPFDKWLSPGAPECVLMAEVKKVGEVIKLTARQFEFVRALYVAIPPMSHALPVGDTSIEVRANGQNMLALVSGDGPGAEICARFNEPDFIKKMLDDVATGVHAQPGDPT